MATLMAETDPRVARVHARDASADGTFFYAVLTTGVYCYPSCKARPPRPENLRFYATRAEAVAAGYRPCKRCRPELPPRAVREAEAVTAACRAIEAGSFVLDHAAASAGLGRAAFIRLFRQTTGVTPAAYAGAWRQRLARAALDEAGSVTEAIYDAGFSSSGRFYEQADGMLGMTPTSWRDGGRGEQVAYAFGATSLGRVLVAATGRGLCAILLGETDASLLDDLRARFPRATLAPAEAGLAARVADVVRLIEEPRASHALPLDIRGTAFQRRVWAALRDIAPGETVSYGTLAQRVGAPRAVRAVGAACGANRLAVAVPCHRAVAADGKLTGYAWGVARKQALLAREKS